MKPEVWEAKEEGIAGQMQSPGKNGAGNTAGGQANTAPLRGSSLLRVWMEVLFFSYCSEHLWLGQTNFSLDKGR